MTDQHDAIPVDPRLDAALRRALRTGDLSAREHEALRRRLGIPATDHPTAVDERAAVIPDPTPLARRVPSASGEGGMLGEHDRSIARQWLEIAAAVVLFAVVGAILVAVFRGAEDEARQATSPALPTATTEIALTGTTATETATEYAIADTWNLETAVSRLTLGPDGRLYLMDSQRDFVTILEPDGSEAGTIAFAKGPPVGMRNDIAVDQEGLVYVLDRDAGKVKRFAPDGTLVIEWGGGMSLEPGRLADVQAIAVDDEGVVYVAENLLGSSARVQTFTADGEFIEEWTRAGDYLFPAGALDLEFEHETLYILAQTYRGQAAILRLDPEGNLVGDALFFGEPQFGEEGVVLDVEVATALAVDDDGNLFLADPFGREIVKLGPDGDVITRWDIAGDPERPGHYLEVAVADDGRVYVADGFRNVVEVFEPAVAAASEPPAMPTATPARESTVAGDCPVSEPVVWDPPEETGAGRDPLGPGDYYRSADGKLAAGPWKDWIAGEDIKVLWIKPVGADLEITGRRLDGDSPPMTAHVPDGYGGDYHATGLFFPTPGCWEIEATAGETTLRFVVEVVESTLEPEPTPTADPQHFAVIDPALADTRWTLVEIDGEPVMEGADITLLFSFNPTGIGGHAGCNAYGVPLPDDEPSIVFQDGSVHIPTIAWTAVACPSEELLALETQYLDILPDVTSYDLDGDRLRLETDDGRALLFQRDD